MATEAKGCKDLIKEVIETGLCTLCGACAGGCPYLLYYKGRIVLLDNCTISDGQCYKYCPRTYVDMDKISRRIFGTPYNYDEIGTVKEILMARSTDKHVRKIAQYGGAVTALLALALKEGLIDSAILTKTSEDKTANPVLVQTENEILQCAGSNYMMCPVLMKYNQTPMDSSNTIGIVGLPCQVLAVAKMKQNPPVNRISIDNLRLVIGLFCTWALSPDKFHRFLKEKFNLLQTKKFDIPPPPANRFDIYTTSGRVSLPLDEIKRFTMPTCTYCLDMTSEFADISIGSVEGIDGWNTVIIRTDIGAELMRIAKAKRTLETDKLPSENLAHLREAALLKKKRALTELAKRSGDDRNLLYVGLPTDLATRLFAQSGE